MTTRRSDPTAGHTEIRLGDTVAGKWVVESMLGSGGMGSVMRAHHVQTGEPVAIKVMHRELLVMEDAARRFALEGEATAKLKSPHVLRIFEIDKLPSGTPFMVMELLEGIDLGTMLHTRGPLPPDRVVHYLIQATEAIAEAHSHGIIHRDLKPRNLFLSKEGIVKVVDFGLAKSLRADSPVSSRTAANLLVGSPNYMSPEQLLAGSSVDERTDIWCLGVTIYQLVTGEPPFVAPDLRQLITRITNAEPPRISEIRPEVSPLFDAVIAQCLRKNPQERYQSVNALRNSLLHLKGELERAGQFRPSVYPVAASQVTVPADQLPVLPPVIEGKPMSMPPSVWTGEDEPTQTSLPDVPSDPNLDLPEDLRSTKKRERP